MAQKEVVLKQHRIQSTVPAKKKYLVKTLFFYICFQISFYDKPLWHTIRVEYDDIAKIKIKKKKVMVPYANNQTIEALRRLPPLIITG